MTFEQERHQMVDRQLVDRGIQDPRLLAAFRKVPRHLFVPAAVREKSYEDHPVPIGEEQTISQPYIVALMVDALRLDPAAKVLEVGTGSGYQAAIVAELGRQVYSIERIPSLAQKAARLLDDLEYHNIQIRIGDGTQGCPEDAPFDGILVAAAAPEIPKPLVEQLRIGGRLVIPIGASGDQKLMVVECFADRLENRQLCECVFVPLIGMYGWKEL